MSRGRGGRSSDGRGSREGGKTAKEGPRSSRTAVRMTAERARAIPWCPKTQPGSMSIVRYGSVPGHSAASQVEIRQFHACP